MSTDYIPQGDGKFLTWVKNLFFNVVANATAWRLNAKNWAHIDPPMITAYETALTKAEDPNRGHADIVAKDEARDTLKKATRLYVKEFLEYNSNITDEERIHAGLPVHDSKPTPVSDPKTMPVATTKLPSPGVVEFHITDSKSEKKGKPAGVRGFELKWVISDTPVTEWDDLIHSEFSTRTPFRLELTGKDRGKVLYFALRWENTRGVKGPWTEIMSVIVP
jgi:hypothetical protein